jgi:superfamily I DNA and/or RNA helicase
MESQKLEHSKRCLMVCAPTNKAITVLCSRFLDSITDDEMFPCNAVLIGDDDKLLDDDYHGRKFIGGAPSKLRSIFLYTFIDTIEADYLFMKKTSTRRNLNNTTLAKMKKIARSLMNRLNATTNDKQVLGAAARIDRITDKLSISTTQMQLLELATVLESILAAIGAWKRENVWQELLRNADVIFCTLASAGTSFLKKAVSDVDDLIVDEAAAATEPEMYIPFQYRPRRLLAVG